MMLLTLPGASKWELSPKQLHLVVFEASDVESEIIAPQGLSDEVPNRKRKTSSGPVTKPMTADPLHHRHS